MAEALQAHQLPMVWKHSLKRVFDVAVSAAVLLLIWPLLLVIAVLVKLNSPGPVIYGGVRAGIGGRRFKILKFRTMRPDAEQTGGYSTAHNDPRLTSIGKFLRRFKLDELPQFINVLLGEMSLVGPRPQVIAYTDKYQGEEKLILSVRPGITDYASIHFSNLDEILGDADVDGKYLREVEPVKNKLRLKYVRDCSFSADVTILIWTVFAVFGIRRKWNT